MLGLPLAPGTAPSDLLADFVSGAAFNRVFEARTAPCSTPTHPCSIRGPELRRTALERARTAAASQQRNHHLHPPLTRAFIIPT